MKHVGKQQARTISVRDPDSCSRCGSNVARELHPEDKANERASELEAATTIHDFFERYADRFKALVQTYPDGRAEMLLEELREMFWSATPAGSDRWSADADEQVKLAKLFSARNP